MYSFFIIIVISSPPLSPSLPSLPSLPFSPPLSPFSPSLPLSQEVFTDQLVSHVSPKKRKRLHGDRHPPLVCIHIHAKYIMHLHTFLFSSLFSSNLLLLHHLLLHHLLLHHLLLYHIRHILSSPAAPSLSVVITMLIIMVR